MNPLKSLHLSANEVRAARTALLACSQSGPTYPHAGICYQLYRAGVRNADTIVGCASTAWPDLPTKGTPTIPIPGYFEAGKPKWEGKQLELRMSLMEHIDGLLADLESQLEAE